MTEKILAFDEQMMLHAIALGEKGRITAPPNPWVGCVIVKDNQIVGEGFHLQPGTPHAEVNALQQAGERARDSTLYSTLEPCIHHGRTPPCCQAIIQAKIKRVVVAVQDPDTNVNGKGIQKLREAGIIVEIGIGAEAAQKSLQAYLWHRKTGRSFCLAKAAISIDGRTAAADSTSQWISCPIARQNAHLLRAESQAIMVGAGTAIYDKPQLTVRLPDLHISRQPLRVILDGKGLVNPEAPLFDTKLAPTLIFTSEACSISRKEIWQRAGAEVQVIPSLGQGLDLKAAFENLGKRGILQVMVEGGSMVLGTLARERLIDQLSLYVGPRILGDKGLPLFKYFGVSTIQEAPVLKLIGSQQFGQCVRLDYCFS
jgi:diaminohydroxyphosphoribosylaminopyrimidine deaminase / 5-amino-6-(5-phosphoribosylamino)uracil reductase